ncbi:hypothetical protein ABPG72_006291 [Tetrahymena utriculariae]
MRQFAKSVPAPNSELLWWQPSNRTPPGHQRAEETPQAGNRTGKTRRLLWWKDNILINCQANRSAILLRHCFLFFKVSKLIMTILLVIQQFLKLYFQKSQ